MKKNVHPKTIAGHKVVCTCGATYTINSTSTTIPQVDTCWKCHPAWTKQFEAASNRGDRMTRFKEQMLKTQQKQKEIQKNAKSTKKD
ncbi:MAG TPA: 50S ribosomal protein L31 [Flavobacterium alvei]|nr:50S ribosomal protein L31 [Candidatus Dojkabacteria bacterium]HQF36102.1 50S ribosomal protein L31 [Candidatus Dojkabacteria bacterium]HQK40492.1 50S ribosomal protein L31 [Flavobacterium alvei]